MQEREAFSAAATVFAAAAVFVSVAVFVESAVAASAVQTKDVDGNSSCRESTRVYRLEETGRFYQRTKSIHHDVTHNVSS